VERAQLRMMEHCDPYVFFSRIQPFLHGFVQMPVLYEGVEEFGGQRQPFAGGSAAQSTVMPLLDGLLGVRHTQDTLFEYLVELRRYMPPAHLALLESVEQGPSVRDYILAHRSPELVEAYNSCIAQLRDFRQGHMEMTARYIVQQARQQASADGERGTGGTPFMHYLKKHRDETDQALLKG
jgi:indoleamine 2,3-dioxygenase